MKWYILFILILALGVSANNLCSDTDNGGRSSSDLAAFEVKGDVKYGITTMSDTCLTGPSGVSASSGTWLREYYCTDKDKRGNEAYDCIRLGYDKCEAGACVGTPSQQTQQQSQAAAQRQHQVSSCGNKIVDKDKGENCDPPGGICFGKTTAQYGTCQSDCRCKISDAAEAAPAVCGDNYVDQGEDCEEDSDCQDNHLCSSCKCVKQLTAEEIEAMKESAETTTETTEEAEAPAEEETQEEQPEVDLNIEGKDLADNAGIKTTSAITNWVKGIVNWIIGLFS